MPLARLLSRGQRGLDAYEVTVEVHLAGGLPAFTITGLPATAVRESRDRVRAALESVGVSVPSRRVTAHLGPADVPKDGGRFDLAIALALIKAVSEDAWIDHRLELVGELALSGEIRSVTGVLPAVLAARDAGRAIIVPEANRAEAALVDGVEAYAARHLGDVLAHLRGEQSLPRIRARTIAPKEVRVPDLADVRGQAHAKRALLIAAAGGHHVLLIGPPGSGKSMLAERFRGLLPPLAMKERLLVASIGSVAGIRSLLEEGLAPPFRAPHHTVSAAALVGGGGRPQPGEISLAHRGVLFLDELPEFSRTALESLREPLEAGIARISRVREQVVFPAQFQLIAAMNPCPCGHLGDADRCTCTPARIAAYRARISGPLLERFDMHIEVPRVAFELAAPEQDAETRSWAAAVADARARQLERAGRLNARLPDTGLAAALSVTPSARALLGRSVEQWRLSMRSSVRVLKVARTIADLGGAAHVGASDVAEALQLRCLDRPQAALSVPLRS